MTILPAMAATGLLDVADMVYGRAAAAFYALRSLLSTVAFAALVGEPRAEGLTRIDPADVGRLIGSDRAPEVKTVRRRFGELAAAGKADRLLAGMAARHVAADTDAAGLFYIDGHVRAYHGNNDVAKAHLARMLSDARLRAAVTGRVKKRSPIPHLCCNELHTRTHGLADLAVQES